MGNNQARILLIDDVIMNLELLERSLVAYGFQVSMARSGSEGLEMAASTPPDLILLDVLMPDMNGYETCKQFKNQPRLRDIPVIFISALNETPDKVKGFEAGGVDYLTKPFNQEEVFVRIRTHLTLRQQRAQIEQLLAQRELAEEAERQQRLALDTLLNSAVALSSTLNLDEVLRRILQDVGQMVPHDLAMMILVEDGVGWVASAQSHLALPLPVPDSRFAVHNITIFDKMCETRQPAVLADIELEPLGIETLGINLPGRETMHSFIGAPVFAEDKLSGILCLMAGAPGFYGERSAQRLQAFAVLVAFAIKNARLYDRAQELAIVQERQRLAQELHDSISQTLFSANALAEVLPRIIDTNPDKARRYMGELTQFTREAMAEMRTLLFELRPDALSATALDLLIKQLCDMFTLKTRVAVELDVPQQIRLPAVQQVAFYRVAQEALNAIAKRAEPTGVAVSLCREADGVELRVRARGINEQGATTAHWKAMREHAATIGAVLSIIDDPEQVTQIVLKEHTDDRPYPNRTR